MERVRAVGIVKYDLAINLEDAAKAGQFLQQLTSKRRFVAYLESGNSSAIPQIRRVSLT